MPISSRACQFNYGTLSQYICIMCIYNSIKLEHQMVIFLEFLHISHWHVQYQTHNVNSFDTLKINDGNTKTDIVVFEIWKLLYILLSWIRKCHDIYDYFKMHFKYYICIHLHKIVMFQASTLKTCLKLEMKVLNTKYNLCA